MQHYPFPGASFNTTPLGNERAQQIDELLRRFPGLKAINPDRSVFDLPLELKGHKATALRISLTPHFPQDRPTLTVLIPVIHPAVDATGRVHTASASSWTHGRSRLVEAVSEAVAALTEGVADTRQPTAAGGAATIPFPAGYPAPLTSNYAGRRPDAQSPNSPNRLQGLGSTSAASAGASGSGALYLPDLSQLSAAELETLTTDEAAFKALVQQVVARSPMARTLEELRVKNRQLAEANMAAQDSINEVRNQLAVVKSSEYSLIKSRYDALHARQAKVLASLGPAVLREALEDAVSEADSTSSALAASFLAGQVPVDQFVDQYVEARVRHHSIDLKRQAAEQLVL